MLEDVMELGGDDMTYSEDSIEIVCDPAAVGELREGLTAKGYLVTSAEAEEVPSTYVTLTEEETKGLEALADSLNINAIRFWEKEMK